MSLTSFFTGAPAKFKVTFADADTRRTVTTKVNDREVDQFLFDAVDNVCGTVDIEVTGGKKLEHTGIKIELIGHIELLYDRANQFEFTSLVRELETPGILDGSKSYPFEFTAVEKQCARTATSTRTRCTLAPASASPAATPARTSPTTLPCRDAGTSPTRAST
tara:strand:+ start:260 stop:748 length:489 start_codon:yes stop_codon:yes gene_type:complete